MAATALPRRMLLEDSIDLADILEVTSRTIPRDKWVTEDEP